MDLGRGAAWTLFVLFWRLFFFSKVCFVLPDKFCILKQAFPFQRFVLSPRAFICTQLHGVFRGPCRVPPTAPGQKNPRVQNETGSLYNLEATPAESTSYKLAQRDRELFPAAAIPGFYTNSTTLPVGQGKANARVGAGVRGDL